MGKREKQAQREDANSKSENLPPLTMTPSDFAQE